MDAPVVFFTNSPYLGGMEAHIEHLARGMAARGRKVGLICPPGERIATLRHACVEAGVEVMPVEERRTASLGRARDLKRSLSGYRDGVLHIHMTGPHGGDLVMLAARAGGLRAIVRTEHQPLEVAPSRMQLFRMRLRDRFIGRVICVSDANRQYFTRTLGRDARKFVTIRNGIDLTRFDPAREDPATVRRSLGLPNGARVVGMVSRLDEVRKGGADFLAMARALVPEMTDVHFLVVGEGALRSELERTAGVMGLADRVTFLGARTDVSALLSVMDVFVMPSHWEGGPITVLEAMAMARPVVATDVGMVREVVTHGEDGLIVSEAAPRALTAAVRRLLESPTKALELGANAGATALASFSRELMVDRVEALYDLALTRKSGPRAPMRVVR
jgi:glycosyltransferase involved in cell wall biosynthesis